MKTKMKTVSLIVGFVLIGFSSLFAQQEITIIDRTSNGEIKFALIDNPSVSKMETTTFLISVLNAGDETQFYLYKVVTDELGLTHEKYQQTYKGIKVEFHEFIVHKDKTGNVVSINGDFARIPIALTVVPKLTFNEAISKAETIEKNIKYHILDLPEEKIIVKPVINKGAKYEVVIIRDHNYNWQLAYKANVIENNILTTNRLGYYSCESGELIFAQPLVFETNEIGSAETLYSDTRSIVADSFAGGYRLRETMRGGTTTSLETYNFNRAPAYFVSDFDNGIANATDFVDNDNNWTEIEHTGFLDVAALDAHWGAEMTFDYFKTIHGRNSFDGDNGAIKTYVHVRSRDRDNNSIIVDMDNAMWVEDYKAVFLGDGNFMDPFVSLDIIGHEVGHGLCMASVGNGVGLIYKAESGALNEGLSDIWGACVEDWATVDKQTWLCGEDATWGIGLRSMSNPNAFGLPDTYQGVNWVDTSVQFDSGGVHTNCSVINYWFFLLSEGGVDTNDLQQPFNVHGVGIYNAARIVYMVETAYMSPNTTFNDARTYTIQAARALFGKCSEEVRSTTNAWHAVGVGTAWVDPVYSLIPSYTLDCNSTTLTINNLDTWEPITWATTNGLLLNGNNSPHVTYGNTVFVDSPNGLSGWIQGTVGDVCSTTNLMFCACEQWNASITWHWSSPQLGEPLQAEVSPLHPYAMKYKWFINGELVETTEDGYLSTYNWPCVGYEGAVLEVIGITDCGPTVPISGGEFYPICSSSFMSSNVTLYPNPALSTVTIQLVESTMPNNLTLERTQGIYLSEIAQIKVFNKTGIVMNIIRLGSGHNSYQLNVSALPTDIYYIEITDGSRNIKLPLVISR